MTSLMLWNTPLNCDLRDGVSGARPFPISSRTALKSRLSSNALNTPWQEVRMCVSSSRRSRACVR